MLNIFLQNKINKQINKCYSSQAHFYPFFCYAEKHVDIISKGLFLLDFFFPETPAKLIETCRLVIRQQLSRTPSVKIPLLPLPGCLKEYLNYYY